MNRNELDAFVAHHQLGLPAIDAALDLSDARPGPMESRRFLIRLLQLAGVLSLAAGVIFFIAANWQRLDILGRFALIQTILGLSGVIALWKPPPQFVGRYAALMLFLMIGGLLALFGQTYQTGADLYELFLTWALLGIPVLIAGQWSVTSAAWLVVLNIAFVLFCGGRPESGWFWMMIAGWTISTAMLLLAPVILNLLLWVAVEGLQGSRWVSVAPRWVGRIAILGAISIGTWAGMLAIFDVEPFSSTVFITIAVLWLAVAIYTLRQRVDVFPLALIAGSFILLMTCALGKHINFNEIGLIFLIALWLIVSSTIGGRILMKFVREWRELGRAV